MYVTVSDINTATVWMHISAVGGKKAVSRILTDSTYGFVPADGRFAQIESTLLEIVWHGHGHKVNKQNSLFADTFKKYCVVVQQYVHFTASTHARCSVSTHLLLTLVSLRRELSHRDLVHCCPVSPDLRLA